MKFQSVAALFVTCILVMTSAEDLRRKDKGKGGKGKGEKLRCGITGHVRCDAACHAMGYRGGGQCTHGICHYHHCREVDQSRVTSINKFPEKPVKRPTRYAPSRVTPSDGNHSEEIDYVVDDHLSSEIDNSVENHHSAEN